MNRLLLLLFLACYLHTGQSACGQHQNKPTYFQRYRSAHLSAFSVYANGGLTSFSGELGGFQKIGQYRLQATVGGSYQLTHFLALRLQGSAFRLRGKAGKNIAQNDPDYPHNDFRTAAYSYELLFEHSIFPRWHTQQLRARFNYYLFSGIGQVHFQPKNPQTRTNIDPTHLEPQLQVERAITIPIGVGWKYFIFNNLSAGFEVGLRLTTTDVLDRLSHNGRNDRYLHFGFGLRYQPLRKFAYKEFVKGRKL